MKKFKYKAESYLKFVNHQRDQALRTLKQVESYKNSLIEKYQWMEHEMKKAYKINEQLGKGETNLHYVNDNNQFIQLLKANMQELSTQIQSTEEEYQEKYKALMALQLKAKKLELHKDNENKKHLKQRRKLIQKQTDEINATRKRGTHAESL